MALLAAAVLPENPAGLNHSEGAQQSLPDSMRSSK